MSIQASWRQVRLQTRGRLSARAFWVVEILLGVVLISDLLGWVPIGLWAGGAGWALFFLLFFLAPALSGRPAAT